MWREKCKEKLNRP